MTSRRPHLWYGRSVGVPPATMGWARSQDVTELTESNFAAEVLESPLPVVVDFWAQDCVPCRLQEPAIQALAEELRGRAKVGRLDVDLSPEVTRLFHIKGVPHLLVVRQGEVVLELVGDHTLPQLRLYMARVDL